MQREKTRLKYSCFILAHGKKKDEWKLQGNMSEVQWEMKQRQGKLLFQDSWLSGFSWFLAPLYYQVTLYPSGTFKKLNYFTRENGVLAKSRRGCWQRKRESRELGTVLLHRNIGADIVKQLTVVFFLAAVAVMKFCERYYNLKFFSYSLLPTEGTHMFSFTYIEV